MIYTLYPPHSLHTTVRLPSSKSISNRVLIIHALSGGSVLPDNLSGCDDTAVVLHALRHRPTEIDVRAGGTAMRFMTAYLSCTPGTHTITGTERMLQRPIGILVDALRRLGAEIEYVGEEGFPPLLIHGKPMEGGALEVEGNISSQFISALLLIAPYLHDGLSLKLTGQVVSRPYIDLTLSVMRTFGAEADWTVNDTIVVKPQPYVSSRYTVENDWSAASYWYEMMALASTSEAEVQLLGLSDSSRQGDAVVKYIFSLLGVRTEFAVDQSESSSSVTLSMQDRRASRLEYDFTHSPDLAQTLIATCCALQLPFRFTGLASLRIKETDRIEAMKKELLKLGYNVQQEEDSTLSWDGQRIEATMEPIDTYDDHRMAMAFAPLAMCHPGLRIRHPEVVSKSYPNFWQDLQDAGFTIHKSEV